MNTIWIPTEQDFKKWVREAVQEYFETVMRTPVPKEMGEERLLNRKEVAGLLRVSLVTLTDWMKRGLPFHKQRGRIYFVEGEVLAYIKAHPPKGRTFMEVQGRLTADSS